MHPKYISLIILLIASIGFVNGKSLNAGKSGGHEADIYAVLPFERCEKISTMIRAIHNNIDHPIGYFEGLRDTPHQDFTWHKLGHRVFFHWGFNTNPRSSTQLATLVEERDWSDDVQKSFWKKVVEEQARRNRETISVVGSTLNFNSTERAYANAFASIITNVHILGDYTTTNISSLQHIDMIVVDLKKALFESLHGADQAKRINKLLDITKSYTDVRECAEAILTILKDELPRFLLQTQEGFFARKFRLLSLPLKRL